MNKLIKIELERAFKNKMLIISVVIGLVIVGFNIWNEIIPARKTLLPAEGDEQVLYLIKDSNEILFYSVAAHAYKQFTIAKPLLDAKISIKGVVEAPKISFDGYHDVELNTEVSNDFPTTSITDIDDLF